TGAALAYHWSRRAPLDPAQRLVVVEMGEAASGSSGRNEGLVVMGRYCHMVYKTVLDHFQRSRDESSAEPPRRRGPQFAAAYCRAAYRNGDLVEETIRREAIDCDYHREGWVQARDADQQEMLTESVRMALDTGTCDWTSITPDEVLRRAGMQVTHNAGFS